MKTEKRLTMALSVLVALMMLAVPLASSSNLFVDGGQTNSNGDAPVVGAVDESYDITFKLNADDKSLDQPKLKGDALPTTPDTVKWYLDEDGNLHAIVPKDTKLGTVINALYSNVSGGKYVSSVEKEGYTLDVWENEANGSVYKYNTDADKTPIKSNMTFSAKWILKDNYAELPVKVIYNDETKEYVKAFQLYPTKTGETGSEKIVYDDKNVIIDATNTFIANGIDKLDTYGIVVNNTGSEEKSIAKVYTFKTTYGDNKEIAKDTTDLKIPVTSKLTVTYTFDEKNFSKIVVSSIAFKDGKDVTLYANKLRSYTYSQVYTALTTAFDDMTKPEGMNKSPIGDLPILDASEKDGKFITTNGYELTGWNEGAQLVESENNASSPLTLDAKLNGYYVIFMSKGQYEYVYVPFGELSADKTTLDIAGVNHWVWMPYDLTIEEVKDNDYKAGKFTTDDSGTIQPFNFASTQNVDDVEDLANDKIPAAVLIACFTPTSSTSYAVFDASSYTYADGASGSTTADISNTMAGTFGNEYVQYLIIPGKVGDKISTPSIAPAYNEDLKVVFISWNHFPAVTGATLIGNSTKYSPVETPYDVKDKYSAEAVSRYSANVIEYTNAITFYDGDKKIGVFYYKDLTPNSTGKMNNGLVAFETDGKAYDADDLTKDKSTEEYKSANNAYESILYPDKDGYEIKQWNDSDKKEMVTIKSSNNTVTPYYVDKVNIKDMKEDLNLYAQFEAKQYVIVYVNTYSTGGSSGMPQYVNVDESVTLYGESTFISNGFKLVSWNERADGKGVSHGLGSSFALNGEQFEDLENGELILYAVWESTGSVTPGDNNEGNNDNTSIYLLIAILVIIIILILVMIFLMKRGQN